MGRVTIKIPLMTIFIGLNMLFLASSARASNIYEPQPLRIIWRTIDKAKDNAKVEISSKSNQDKIWQKSCQKLADAFLVGKGPWGMGVFKSVSCHKDQLGRESKENIDFWTLTYFEGERETSLTLRQPGNSKFDAARVSYRTSQYAMQFFLDAGFVDLVALRLLNELPVMGWLPRADLGTERTKKTRSVYVPPSGARLYKTILPPEDLTVYSSSLNGSFHMPMIEGRAVRSALLEPEVLSLVDQLKNVRKQRRIKEYSVTWQFDDAARRVNATQGVWVHDARGAGFLSSDLDAAIHDATDQLDAAIDEGLLSRILKGLKASAASGYVGVRYGSQVLSGDPLLKKTSFIGLLAEVRGGPVEGLRYYWDKVPLHKQVVDGLNTEIEWSRHIIGKSFGLNLTRFVDRVDVTPKVGIWSFNAKLVDSYNDDGTAGTVGRFKMAKGMSFSLEAGIEWLSNWYTIRPWYSYDYANAINTVTSRKVSSSRVGFDTYWTAGPVFKVFGMPLKTAVMAFFIYESISLSAANTNPTLNEGSREIVGVSFSGGYAGAGLAISW